MDMTRFLRRSKGPGDAAPILGSPLNDAELVQRAFGTARPGPAELQQKYFALAVDQRPSLSAWFDSEFYRSTNPDVAVAGTDPYLHFLRHGLEEGRNPHPLIDLEFVRLQAAQEGFDGAWDLSLLAEYLQGNPQLLDLAGAEMRRVRRELTGSFDGFQHGLAVGWAYDPQDPEARLTVEIVEILDGSVNIVGRGRADIPRADLREQRIGDGRYHFSVKLSDALADGKPHPLQARVAGGWLAGVHEFQLLAARERGFDSLPDAETRAFAIEASAAWPRREANAYVRRIMDVNLMLGTREIASAAHELEALDAAYPGDALVQLKTGEAQMRLGNHEAAAAAYALASRSERLAGWALLGLGNARQALGDWQEADECYRRGFAAAPGLPHLAERVRQAGYRAARAQARDRANAGDAASALELLMPELLARPTDAEIGDLVIGVLDQRAAGPGAPTKPTHPLLARAERSRQLLEVVLAHAERQGGAAR